MGKPGKSKGEKSMKTHSVKFNFIMNAILTVSSVLFPLITFPYISRVLLVAGNGKAVSYTHLQYDPIVGAERGRGHRDQIYRTATGREAL